MVMCMGAANQAVTSGLSPLRPRRRPGRAALCTLSQVSAQRACRVPAEASLLYFSLRPQRTTGPAKPRRAVRAATGVSAERALAAGSDG